ncbi:flagellar motor switch protein FliG [Treponema zuelzerae]|uniref:Flagellar motor switch protein FliG n=1 Tax=Teretinema zuelzerae TaxID=156 RepID=A0AAE3EHS1_9SPIR|nr:flagellar motor switch protein FliG [Teretinema zuelzerae]MCD1654939.1 flagellar motor switch protein FliG [Teretinema zuelzerae]
MNLNDRRLGAYKKILNTENPSSSGSQPDSRPGESKPLSERSNGGSKQANDGPARSNGGSARSNGGSAQASGRSGQSNGGSKQASGRSGQANSGPGSARGNELPGLIKVPDSSSGGRDSPFRRVAKFLLIIGVDEAAKVLSKLSPDQVEKVVLELASIRRVEKDEASLVLAEFEALFRKAREPSGGVDTARSILEAAFGPERAEAMLQKAVPQVIGRPFDYLDGMDPARVYRLIADELPAVKALVLSKLVPAQAAGIIKAMAEGEKTETIIRLAKLKDINPDVLRRVDDAIREKVQSAGAVDSESVDGRSALAEILRKLDPGKESSILSGLIEADPELGKDIRERLFTLADVVRCDDRFIQERLRTLDDRDIALLVARKDEAFRKKIFDNISRTRGALVLEEEKLLVPLPGPEAVSVTAAFFAAVRKGWEEGRCGIDDRDDAEEWIR